jgi:hypothetical protein
VAEAKDTTASIHAVTETPERNSFFIPPPFTSQSLTQVGLNVDDRRLRHRMWASVAQLQHFKAEQVLIDRSAGSPSYWHGPFPTPRLPARTAAYRCHSITEFMTQRRASARPWSPPRRPSNRSPQCSELVPGFGDE